MSNENPYDICTWSDETGCIDCGLQGKLKCRLNPKDFWFFILNQIPSLVMAFFWACFDRAVNRGMVVADNLCGCLCYLLGTGH